MKLNVTALLSVLGGYVDTLGYLALQGLFTSHVTGNFVTLGAALVFGTTGILAKMLALPVFCAVIVLTRLVSSNLPGRGLPVLESVLTLKIALLTVAAVLAIRMGPFSTGDAWPAILTGMMLVSAMAIQNAVQRIHLGSTPPTTIMTGTTTQLMIDLADVIHGLPSERRTATLARMRSMLIAVVSFALGAACGAALFAATKSWCFVVPPVLALLVRWAVKPGGTPLAAAAGG
jgi:uncharacterized membrane protein YoaK (UPF0700 family)